MDITWNLFWTGVILLFASVQAEGVLSLLAPVRLSVRLSVCPSVNFTCLHDNSSQVWARIAKFAPNMHPGIPSTGVVNGGHWPWPSSSFWSFWLRILGNSACPHDNSSQTWAKITKFAPSMHHGILSAGIENGGHWPWLSRSFWPLWIRIVGNSAYQRYNSSQIWTKITKFAQSMHPGILSPGIENGGHWPWSSNHLAIILT